MATISNTSAPQGTGISSPLRRSPLPRIQFNGVAVIATVSTALALATASECHSIFYWPSLLYGAVLWGWWGVLATTMWKAGQRLPGVSGFSAKTLAAHLALACTLGLVHLLLLGSTGFSVARPANVSTYAVWTELLNINRYGLEILIYGFIAGIIVVVQLQLRAQRDA